MLCLASHVYLLNLCPCCSVRTLPSLCEPSNMPAYPWSTPRSCDARDFEILAGHKAGPDLTVCFVGCCCQQSGIVRQPWPSPTRPQGPLLGRGYVRDDGHRPCWPPLQRPFPFVAHLVPPPPTKISAYQRKKTAQEKSMVANPLPIRSCQNTTIVY